MRDRVPVPYAVLIAEAVVVAKFCRQNWEPRVDGRGKVTRPGLESAVGSGLFTENTGTEVLELHQALQVAQTNYHYLVSCPDPGPIERARVVLSELRRTLAWLFDDGVEDDNDARLATLVRAHGGALSQDAIASALYEYAVLAARNLESVGRLGAFDASLIDEAHELYAILLARPSIPGRGDGAPEQDAARDLRNRLAALLYERMQRARAAARYVFRHQPILIRQVTSAYGRAQRTGHRRPLIDLADPAEAGAITELPERSHDRRASD